MPANVQYSEENEEETDRESWVLVTKLTIIPPPIKETHQTNRWKRGSHFTSV